MSERTWSPQQEAIFDTFRDLRSGHFVVQARAGTGKSTTCAEGILRAPDRKKLYVAFNRRAVDDFKTRIQSPNVRICSLNGLGHGYVMRNWEGVQPDDSVEFDRIKAEIRNPQYPKARAPFAQIKDIVAFAKNTCPFATPEDLMALADKRGIVIEDYQAASGWTIDDAVDAAAAVMVASKERDKQNRISFNDQLWLPVVMGWVVPWYDLVVVDEAQDLNATQHILITQACKKRTGRIALVGDPRQAIYAFRGANTKGMSQFTDKHEAKVLPLTRTYRCPRLVVDLAKTMVPDYDAAPDNALGTISDLTDTQLTSTVKPGDAILSRLNAPLMGTCLALLRKGTPAFIEGRDIGKTLLSVIEKVCESVKEPMTIELFAKHLEEWRLRRVTILDTKDGTEAAIENVNDQALTILAVAEDCSSVQELQSRLTGLFQDGNGNRPESVVLSSIHRSKGLEWNNVFVLRWTLPKVFSSVESEAMNIAYVGVTRAKSTLTFVHQSEVPFTKTVVEQEVV